jgi:hypothetical protein
MREKCLLLMTFKKALTHAALASATAFLHLSAGDKVLATPQMFGSNYYDFIQVADPFAGSNNTWATASAAAASMQFNGASGYLAVITSQAENDFIYNLVSSAFSTTSGGWLGGKYPEGWLEGPEAGQAFSYTNWGGIEPNNNGYSYMVFGAPLFTIQPSQWADAGLGLPSVGDPAIGFFVEYENPNYAAVPGPLPLLGVGAAFGFSRKLRKRIKSSTSPDVLSAIG